MAKEDWRKSAPVSAVGLFGALENKELRDIISRAPRAISHPSINTQFHPLLDQCVSAYLGNALIYNSALPAVFIFCRRCSASSSSIN